MWDLGEKASQNADKIRGGAMGKLQFVAPKYINKGKSLVLLQVNCRSIYNKALNFWKLVDT
jgi:hypothetical protein